MIYTWYRASCVDIWKKTLRTGVSLHTAWCAECGWGPDQRHLRPSLPEILWCLVSGSFLASHQQIIHNNSFIYMMLSDIDFCFLPITSTLLPVEYTQAGQRIKGENVVMCNKSNNIYTKSFLAWYVPPKTILCIQNYMQPITHWMMRNWPWVLRFCDPLLSTPSQCKLATCNPPING